ncbi:N-6 DNA methylase [Wenzhouxiangella sp. EGI_FJ10409]|uniref:N-6 DNA methylase n=1 Tax=Wenzhouxiangella sp. EGI_FJ10409 TaxID=3243767 RepID=UPI0035D58D11
MRKDIGINIERRGSKFVEKETGRSAVIALLDPLVKGDIPDELSPELVSKLLRMFGGSDPRNQHFSSLPLAKFVAALAEQEEPSAILDPACGSGSMLRAIVDATSPSTVDAVEKDTEIHRIAEVMLGQEASVRRADFLEIRNQLGSSYDLIVADLPLAARLSDGQKELFPERAPRGLSEAFVYSCCEKLSKGGLAIVTVENRLATSSKFRQTLNKLNCCVAGAIYVPSGLIPGTLVSAHLLLIEVGYQQPIFTAKLPETDEQIATVLKNWYRRSQSGHPSLGCISECEKFLGYPAIEAAYKLRSQFRKGMFSPLPADQVFAGKPERFDPKDDDLSEVGPNEAIIDITGTVRIEGNTPPSNRPSFRFKLNGAVVDPAFFRSYIKSELGQLTMQASAARSDTGLLMPTRLMLATFYLPNLEAQGQITDVERRLERLESEVSETRELIWEGQTSADELENRLEFINRDDKDSFWLETLPYPLASILWRHRTAEAKAVVRLPILKDFFEALSAFLSTVHLSAFTSDDHQWAHVQPNLISGLKRANTSLQRATFGTWKTVHATLAKELRRMLDDNELKSLAFEIYCIHSERFLRAISESRLAKIFDEASGLRNQFLGHGGAMGESVATGLEKKFLDLLQDVREVFGLAWRSVDLVQPGSSSFRDGQHHYKMPKLMGTRSSFERVERSTTSPMDVDSLYLLGNSEAVGLKLLPFFRMAKSQSPSSCYFFNRCESQHVRFVSYHDEESPEIIREAPGTREAIRNITTSRSLVDFDSGL